MYLHPAHPIAETFFGWTLLLIMGHSILFTWVFNHTNGSVLIALLLHAAIAVTGLFVASTGEDVLTILVTWTVVLGVIRYEGGELRSI